MKSTWSNNVDNIFNFIDIIQDTPARVTLEQLMLFPVDIQDKIIEDISLLPLCTNEAVAKIINIYKQSEIHNH